MTNELSLIPQIISARGNKQIDSLIAIFSGVVLISLLSQVAIPLPWTPVPITGQTFAVALVSLLWGRKRGIAVLLTYLAIGGLGLPVFAMGKSGLFGPTIGYLFGMMFASYWVGYLSDKGFTNTYLKTLIAAYSGSAIVFIFGVFGLSFFLPKEVLLMAGVIPFLPGDLIKNLLASAIAFNARKARPS